VNEEIPPTNEVIVAPIEVLVEVDSGLVETCNASTTTKPNHSGPWSTAKNECPVPFLGSSNNPCFMLPIFGCYCIVQEKVSRLESSSCIKTNQNI